MPPVVETSTVVGENDEWPIHVPAVVLEESKADSTDHLLLWQVRGKSDFLIRSEPTTLTSGHALWIPAGVKRSVTVGANSVLLPFGFSVETTATTLSGTTYLSVDRGLHTLLLALLQSRNSVLKTSVNLERQILTIIERNPAPKTLPLPTTATALSVAETLRFNPGDDRTVTEHATTVHASYKTIERAFLSETGLTFRQWRARNRLETAASLLRSDTALSAVANRVGYQNLSAFSRAFKNHFEMTPTEYIRRYRTST